MILNALKGSDGEISGRLWRFANCEFDEFTRELRVNGKRIDLESKPLDVLQQLLLHAGEVVTKDELIESVWSGTNVVEGSLATAVSKLRKAFGDAAGEGAIVITIPRIGYRLGVPVLFKEVAAPASVEFQFKPGDTVPGRDQWQLTRCLEPASQVWLADHPKTKERRVFKFAADGLRLKALKREVTLARLLKESLGERPDFVRLLEWNFESPPYYLESEYCGLNLIDWASGHGGLEKVPFEIRLQVFLEVAGAVAAAHEAGVLHKDLKPSNILVLPAPGGAWHIKVADFGCGGLVEPSRLKELGITNLGFTCTEHPDSVSGTLMYMAPEVLAGQSPTALADVYSLGVILYQLVACDFRKPLSPGWEADAPDPLLREDIAAAACGDAARRLPTVAALMDRLRTLDERRVRRNELELAQQRAHLAERRLAAARARRPWILAAVVALAIGLGVSFTLYRKAVKETAAVNAMNQFLANDLLGRSDPFHSGKSQETLVEAVKQASPDIDRKFHDSPEVAARLHHAIARALDNRSEFPGARSEYDRAAAFYIQADGPLSQDAIVVGLQRAAMEARTYQSGGLEAARSILAEQQARLKKIGRPRTDVAIWLTSAKGMIALISNDAKTAVAQFQAAVDKAQTLGSFDASARLTLKQRLAFAYIRLGQGATAERLFRELMAAFSSTDGPRSASVLRVRLNLAQAFMIQGKNQEAIRETSDLYPLYVAQFGETHELTMQLLTTRAQCEGSIGLWDDAIRDDMAVYKLAVRKQGASSFFAIGALSDGALAQCRAGHYSDGERNARKAWEASAKAFGPRAGLTGGAADTLAGCLIGIGKLREASTLLDGIDIPAVAQLSGFPGWFANVTLKQGEIAFRQGNYAAAKKFLETAMPVFSRPDAEAYQKHAMEALAAALAKHP